MKPRLDYEKILDLRLQGKTYGEIRSIFQIPKSTLSTWFSKLKVSKKAKRILQSKRKNGYFKLIEFNKIRTVNIKKENDYIIKDYESKIGQLNDRELMLLGAALYWGEGYKNFSFKNRPYPYLSFANSDPRMIKVFINFIDKILNIPKSKIKAQITIYPGIEPIEVVDYWRKITQLPKENFRLQIGLSRASQGKRPKNLLPYGTLQLRINRRQEFFKIKGLINGIIKNTDST